MNVILFVTILVALIEDAFSTESPRRAVVRARYCEMSSSETLSAWGSCKSGVTASEVSRNAVGPVLLL